jgi:hypothetical protein
MTIVKIDMAPKKGRRTESGCAGGIMIFSFLQSRAGSNAVRPYSIVSLCEVPGIPQVPPKMAGEKMLIFVLLFRRD